MLNLGTLYTQTPPVVAPTEYTFNDQFVNFGGSSYGSREIYIYVEQNCDISWTCGSVSNYGVIEWRTGRQSTSGSGTIVVNYSPGNYSGNLSLTAGRTYTFRAGGYSGSSSWGITATLKKGWYSSAKNDYLDWYNGSWVNPNWPIT